MKIESIQTNIDLSDMKKKFQEIKQELENKKLLLETT